MSADFLLELLSEEIPARMQAKAAADLARLFEAEIARAGLKATAIEPFVTPRRLGLIARGLPLATQAVAQEVKGPRADAPAQALAGFLGKTGLARDQLVERADAKGNRVLFAVIETPGRPTEQVLADAIPAVVKAFPWPKAMRWGAASRSTESLRWVRPLQGIVAILGSDLVDVEIGGVRSGFETVGHRFHHPGAITIGGAHDYAAKLRACHVIVDAAERQAIVRDGAAAAAAAVGLSVVPDEGLVAENAGLTEWPVPLLGSFDPAFLAVPREVIQLTMRTNQKYFACTDASGALAPAFICTGNIDASDGGAAIVAGNRKVLAARLADAKFFWEQDLRTSLSSRVEKLRNVVFNDRLGSMYDRVEALVSLSGWLAKHTELPIDSHTAEAAAYLCKADLSSSMVEEFPELQGTIGGYYAIEQGSSVEISDAIREHYRPVGPSDVVPNKPLSVVLAMADKLSLVASFFAVEERPTGSKDPFALRRASLGDIRLRIENAVRPRSSSGRGLLAEAYVAAFPVVRRLTGAGGLGNVINKLFLELAQVPREKACEIIQSWGHIENGAEAVLLADEQVRNVAQQVLDFYIDRLKVQQREAGVRHDLIDAIFALGGEDDLVRLLARVKALQAFVASEDGANLLAGYKRAANIVAIEAKKDFAAPSPRRGEGWGEGGGALDVEGTSPSPNPLPPGEGFQPAEASLIAALDAAEPAAEAAVAREEFGAAMAALASLRAPIDRFFDEVTVNDPDPAIRARRLALLARIRDAVHRVADFSKIEG